ncbi:MULTISPECIES: hypothetical protein [unclassified Chryseobacterium]|uniref:hypothetical protein n=1 Tax=unclassified Chryseobacterium TaxID=2593645 RepID=UPI0030183E5A
MYGQNNYDVVNLIGKSSFTYEQKYENNSNAIIFIADTIVIPKEGKTITFSKRKQGIYIICKSLILNGTLSINNQPLQEESLPLRSGEILIAANEAVFNTSNAIIINNNIRKITPTYGAAPVGRPPKIDKTFLIINNYQFNEENIIENYLQNSEKFFNEYCNEYFDIINSTIQIDFSKIPEYSNSKLKQQKETGLTSAVMVDSNGKEVKLFPREAVKNLALLLLSISKNFKDLNYTSQNSYTIYNNLVLDEGIVHNNLDDPRNLPLNFFIDFNSKYLDENGKFIFASKLQNLQGLNESIPFLQMWEIEMLKYINQELNLAVKESDKKNFLNQLRVYKNIQLSREIVSNEKTTLIKEINQIISQNENKYFKIDQNQLYIIKDNNIGFYSIPNSAKVVSYTVNNISKLGSISLKDKRINLSFKALLFQNDQDLKTIKQLSNKYGGLNFGVLNDWKIESYTSNLDIENMNIRYIGNGIIDFSLDFESESISLTKIINQPFYINLSCKFENNEKFISNIPISFGLSTNKEIKINGTKFQENYHLFDDLSSYQSIYQKFSIYNNCKFVSENNNKFEKIVVVLSYSLDGKLQTYERTLTTIGQNDDFDIPYSNSQPDFNISVKYYYENEIYTRMIEKFDRFQVNIDGNVGK